MAPIHTHYDNLKVARNAPPEVIRAAYKTLSHKYHPDRNLGNTEASRIMAIINASYEALSDPDKRKEHDLWITQQERAAAEAEKSNNQPRQTSQQTPTSFSKTSFRKIIAHILQYWHLYGIATFFIWIWVTDKPSTPPPSPKPYQTSPPTAHLQPSPTLPESQLYQASPSPTRTEYVRPSTAPNGQPWPVSAGYVKGYRRLHIDGLSTVTIDNSQNDSDVFVKLVFLDSEQAYPVRQFYIPAFGSFTLNKVTAGNYDIRYRDLSNGSLSRSEAFNLEEIPTYNGTQFSNLTMTLYKVPHGNMQTYGLSESDF